MALIWTGLTALFFFSLFMVSVSVFTPKTALFFKEKTRTRGAILWLSTALVCIVLVNEFSPGFSSAPRENATMGVRSERAGSALLPGYSFQVVENKPGAALRVLCTLDSPVDVDKLRALALKVHASNAGHEYAEVFIQWRVSGLPGANDPWAVTNCLKGNWEIALLSPKE